MRQGLRLAGGPGRLIVARVTIQTCMNEKLQQCGVQLPPSNQHVSGDIITQAEGAITGLFFFFCSP